MRQLRRNSHSRLNGEDVLRGPSTGQNERIGIKRRRIRSETGLPFQEHSRNIDSSGMLNTAAHAPQGWMPMPVLEYNGPDFGFDATQILRQGASEDIAGSYSNADAGGFFSDAGWDAFIQGLDYGHFNM